MYCMHKYTAKVTKKKTPFVFFGQLDEALAVPGLFTRCWQIHTALFLFLRRSEEKNKGERKSIAATYQNVLNQVVHHGYVGSTSHMAARCTVTNSLTCAFNP